jgi:mitotic spindle assembly checkpoint protein MAD2
MSQLEKWVYTGAVQKLILVVKSIETGDTLERWAFDVNVTKLSNENIADTNKAAVPAKTGKELTQEIQAIIRQITASVTFLPLLNEPCCFDLLVYADKGAQVPGTWGDTDPCIIQNGEKVTLRSFSTKIHSVGASVSYKLEDGV